jgi:hypothetical protein
MKIVLIIPDGVGIRNYLYSDVIDNLSQHDVVLLHNLKGNLITELEKHYKNIIFEYLPIYKESWTERVIREISSYARLNWNANTFNNPTILLNWTAEKNTFQRKLLYGFSEILGLLFAKNYHAIRFLEIIQENISLFRYREINKYKKIIKKLSPDVIFCTHQRVAWLTPIFKIAAKQGVKTCTAIYSWDNLPKARLPWRADSYFVWSDYMAKELTEFYPYIKKEQVIITGTPQFDFYFNPKYLKNREEFLIELGCDPNKKIVLFSGDDVTSSPNDPEYLEDLLQVINNDDDFQNVNVVFRRCPVDFSTRYDEIISRYEPIVSNPLWMNEVDPSSKRSLIYPKMEDVAMLVNLAFHCDVVINLGSTMAVDFAVFNKPALFINYTGKTNPQVPVSTSYSYQHFRTMDGLDPVGWINSKEEIAEKVKLALEQPNKIGPDRLKWLARIAQPDPLKTASKRIVEALLT